jgi:hypothetical protein
MDNTRVFSGASNLCWCCCMEVSANSALFVAFTVICSPGQWICSPLTLG